MNIFSILRHFKHYQISYHDLGNQLDNYVLFLEKLIISFGYEEH